MAKDNIFRLCGYSMIQIEEIGDCPNAELPTAGGHVFWETLESGKEYTLQKNIVTGLARILDKRDVRKAWGSITAMNEKFRRLNRKSFLEPGDVIGISRKKALNLYEHYAVYIGKNEVIQGRHHLKYMKIQE